jgi:hypothetical protein
MKHSFSLFRWPVVPAFFVGFVGLAFPGSSAAHFPQAPQGTQSPKKASLQERYQKYLSKDFIKKGHWVLDYDKARTRARREGKLIFVYFTRTYAP